MNQILDWILQSIGSFDPLLRNIAAGVAIMLETSLFVGLIMPGDTIVLIASTGVADLPDFFTLIGFVLLGSMIGETVGYSIGRLFGDRIRASKLGQRFGEQNWRRADVFIARRGGPAVAISRFLPVLHSLVPVVAGAARMRYRTFITWTFGACLVWSSVYVGIGYIARASYEQVASNFKFGALIFVGVLLAFVILVHFAKKRIAKEADRMMTDEAIK